MCCFLSPTIWATAILDCLTTAARTPHLDALANEGLCIAHMPNAPACSPSRAALGRRYSHRGALTPMEVRGADRIALDEVTLADSFKAAGYATGLIGKWHNGALTTATIPTRAVLTPFRFLRRLDGLFRLAHRAKRRALGQRRTVFDRRIYRRSRRFSAQASERKFLLCVTYNAPHSPLQAPDDVARPYLGQVPAGWASPMR